MGNNIKYVKKKEGFKKTKIDVFSGFLGAGKTTLIKKLLKEALQDTKVVLIENEFGEIGIDGGFLKESGIEIKEMNSGCICCSLVGDFGESLKEVLSTYSPERVLIEPSGVGKLSDVVKAVEDVAADLDVEINSAVDVVDATKCKMYIKNFGEFFVNQIEHAGTIILSRTGKISQEKLDQAIQLIREHNAEATIITTPWEQLDGKDILKTIEGEDKLAEMMKELLEHAHHEHHHDHDEHCNCGCHGHLHEHHHEHCHEEHHHEHDEHCTCGCHEHHHEHHQDHHGHHHADEIFTSWGVETPHKFEEDVVKAALEKLSNTEEFGIILRAKGMLPKEDGTWIYFDLVPCDYEMRQGTPEYTGRLCVIGTKLDEAGLEQLFGI